MIPGIDLSGTIVHTTDHRFVEGQQVIVTGFAMGMSHTGGFSEYARVPADWIVPLPNNLTLKEAMIFGTAGFTAALSIMALQENGMNTKINLIYSLQVQLVELVASRYNYYLKLGIKIFML